MEFSRPEYWNGEPYPPPGDFPTQGSNPGVPNCRQILTRWVTREAQEYWSWQPVPSPVDLPDPGIEPGSPALQADSLPAELPGKPGIKPTSPALELWSLNHWTAKEVPPKCFVLGVSPCVCQSRERKQEQVGQAMCHDADLMSVTEEGMEGELGGKRPGCLLCSSEKVLVGLLSSGAKSTCHSTCGAGMTWL